MSVSFYKALVCFLISGMGFQAIVSAQSIPSVAFNVTSVTAFEKDFVPAALTIKRSDNKGRLTVNYELKTSALYGKDFSELPDKIIFENGQSEARLVIHPLTDYYFHRKDKELVLTLLPGAGYNIDQNASTARVTIQQDPSPKPLPADSIFFSKISDHNPGLTDIKKASQAGDFTRARKLLAAYYRQRSTPQYIHGRGRASQQVIDNALQNTYSITGLTYNFGKGKIPGIDWSYSVEGNPNWAWEFNRFHWWTHLANAYLEDTLANARYAERIFWELRDWLNTSPLDVTIVHQLTPGNRWRHLEAGIRLESSWTRSFSLLKNSSLLDDDLLVDWVKAFYMHMRFLEVSAELFTNRGFTEAVGLFTGASFFPEFKESEGLQKLALTRLENIIKVDVNADGSFKEFSPSYHQGSMSGYMKLIDFARLNKIELPAFIYNAFESQLNYLLLASEPGYTIPQMNDSYKFKVNSQLAYGQRLFPHRKDFEYIATERAAGTKPSVTSHLFADAGQALMRSGWNADDNYLLMDAGPVGTSHGHEDKLAIHVNGYGVRHIIDCGPYNYEDSNIFRKYCLTTLAKSAPVVDGLSQNRKKVKLLQTKKTPVIWHSSSDYDYAAAAYGADSLETWGQQSLRPAMVTRHIIYLKPAIWVIVDDFQSLDKGNHEYSSFFQCSDDSLDINMKLRSAVVQIKPGEFDPFNRTIATQLQPSLSITPVADKAIRVSVAKGQMEPQLSGWQFEKSTSWKKQPIPTLRYDVNGKNTQMAYVLSAAPASEMPGKPVIQKLSTEEGTYGLTVSGNTNAVKRIILVALNGKTLKWKKQSYKAPAAIISYINGKEQITLLNNQQ